MTVNDKPLHVAIVDWELQNPGGRLAECAKALKYSEGAISQVRNSDAFQDYRSRCLQDHQTRISDDVINKVGGLVDLSLSEMMYRIQHDKTLSMEELRLTTDLALTALGFNPKHTGQGSHPWHNVVVVQGADHALLERARDKMRTVTLDAAREALAINGEATAVKDESEHKQLPTP